MKLIFAVDRNWAIGFEGAMIYHIPRDLQHFKEITMGNIMVMGRKTFYSLRQGKPLPGREHIVLTRQEGLSYEGTHIINSPDQLDEKIEELDPSGEKDVFLIGGGNLVSQLIDQCSYAYITKIDASTQNCDTHIPNLDKLGNWEQVSQSEVLEDNGLEFKFTEYRNTNLA